MNCTKRKPVEIRDYIRSVRDYPEPGILYRDITPILNNGEVFRSCLDLLSAPYAGQRIDKIAGVEARGFLLGGALADRFHCGFIPLRKAGKLPRDTFKQPYELEYGSAILEMHTDAVVKGERVLIIDDLIATGGSAEAAIKVLKRAGAKIIGAGFIVALDRLEGLSRLARMGIPITTLVRYS